MELAIVVLHSLRAMRLWCRDEFLNLLVDNSVPIRESFRAPGGTQSELRGSLGILAIFRGALRSIALGPQGPRAPPEKTDLEEDVR